MNKIISLVLFTLSFTVFADVAKRPSQAAIASAHPVATRAGFEVLEKGGNAFDAAVAVSATLAVVEPYSSGIGGGGFWLLHDARSKKNIMVDGREKAPLKATRNMYQDKQGNVIPGLSVNGPLAAGIPGEPAALVHIAHKYGRLPLKVSLAPAIRAAREGFKVTRYYQRMVGFRLSVLQEYMESSEIFLQDDNVPEEGYLVKQPGLARTLELLAEKGHAGFYHGEIARELIRSNNAAGGIWSMKDLAQYRVVEREPVVLNYRGYRITSVAPPSSGGVALAEILNMLSFYKLERMSDVSRIHVIAEAMRRAYRDRAEYLGDTDFVDVPMKKLTGMKHATRLQQSIDLEKATPSSSLKAVAVSNGGNDTTHFSIIDKTGNRVSATLSINYPFGSGFVAGSTGVLLNDEMDDFSSKPGEPNVYGLVGAEANAIEPGKRMLSSMSPTFIENDSKVAIIGTPGGSRIITMVLHGILGFVEGKSAQQIVDIPRFHHQYLPDHIQYEPGAFNKNQLRKLKLMGHQLKAIDNTYGNMHVVTWDRVKNKVDAASDKRGEGLSIVKN